MAKTARPSVVVYLNDEEMKAQLERQAASESRSVSNYIVALLKAEFDRIQGQAGTLNK
jgi:hypothetical protein